MRKAMDPLLEVVFSNHTSRPGYALDPALLPTAVCYNTSMCS